MDIAYVRSWLSRQEFCFNALPRAPKLRRQKCSYQIEEIQRQRNDSQQHLQLQPQLY